MSIMKTITLSELMIRLDPLNPKTKPIINGYCKKGIIPAYWGYGKWNVDESYVEKSIDWRHKHKTLSDLENTVVIKYDVDMSLWKANNRNLMYKLRDIKFINDEHALLFSGKFVSNKDIDRVTKILEKEATNLMKKNELISIKDAAKNMEVSVYQIKQMIKEDKINASLVGDNWYLSELDVSKFIEERDKYIGVYSIALEVSKDKKTIFDIENRVDRAMLNNYMRKSEVAVYLLTSEELGIHGDRRNSLYVPASRMEEARDIIEDYIGSFGKQEEQLRLMKNSRYFDTHVITKKILLEFESSKTLPGMVALYDIIINSCPKEVIEIDNEDIKLMMSYANKKKKKIYKYYLSMFLKYVKERYDCIFTTTIKETPTGKGLMNNYPYSLEQFYSFGFMLLNEKYIQENKMIQKAIADPKAANAWFYTAWHYICAWRKEDILNIPILPFISDYEKALNSIKQKDYSQAEMIATLLEDKINNSYQAPAKTEERQKERFLVIEIRKSLRAVIGIIYIIISYHFYYSDLKLSAPTLKDYERLFGDDYIKIFGKKPFSNRRANKSFLGEVVTITEKKSGVDKKVYGYRVGSYARAHVEDSSGLSTTTSKYLQTKLDGLTEDEILMELFETGTCSFVPYYLLEIIYGKKFSDLNVKDQTQVIKQFGVSAHSAEELITYLDKVYNKTEQVMEIIFKDMNDENRKELAEEILDNLITKKAYGKEVGVCCIRAARKLPCVYKGRDKCLGCPFAIYQRTFFFSAIKYVNKVYLQMKNAKTDSEVYKYQRLLDLEYLPSIVEMIEVAEKKHQINVDSYKDLLIEIIKNRGLIND